MKTLKTCRGFYLDLDLYIHDAKKQIYLVTQTLQEDGKKAWTSSKIIPLQDRLHTQILHTSPDS